MEWINISIKIGELFSANRVIYELIEQDFTLDLNFGFKIFKLRKILDEYEEYVMSTTMLRKIKDFTQMTDEENKWYNATMNSIVSVTIPHINDTDFEKLENLKLPLKQLEAIIPLINS